MEVDEAEQKQAPPSNAPTQPLVPLQPDPLLDEYQAMSVEDRQLLSCDEVFSIYLRETCRKVNAKFYSVIVKFILLFRECLNEYGWQKKRELLSQLKDE